MSRTVDPSEACYDAAVTIAALVALFALLVPARRKIPRWLARHLPSIVVFLGVLALWQFASTGLGIREYILPSPAAVARALTAGEIPWLTHAWTTALEVVGAFLLAGASGVVLGVAIAWS